MAATGYTPISLYYSTTASAVPTAGNLANGELALNIADMKLYAKNSAGTVTLLASNASTTGVDSLSFGSTGLTPSTATTGAITVAGTLNVANGGTGLTSLTAGYIPFGSGTSAFGSSADLFWDSANARLGIGTSSPAAILATSKSSSTQATGLLLRNPDGTTGSSISIDFETSSGTSGTEAAMAGRIAGLRTGSGTSGALTFSTTNAGTLGEKMRLDSAGNLGLGRTPVAYGTFKVLDVAGSAGAIQKWVHTGSTVELQAYASSGLTAVGSATNHPLLFTTNDTERARINSSGAWSFGSSGTNTGNAGEVLTSQGSGSAPTWVAASSGGVSTAKAYFFSSFN